MRRWRRPGSPRSRSTRNGRGQIERSRADTGEAAVAPNVVIITSGSTGLPKGMLLPHSHYTGRMDSYAGYLYGTGGPPILTRPAPLLIYGISLAYAGIFKKAVTQLCFGGPVVFLPATASWLALIHNVAAWEDAIFPATPNLCRQFLNHAPQHGLLFPRLRALLCAGQPLFAEEKRRIVETVTPNLCESYGTAATGTISFLRAGEVLGKAASVGRPWPTIDVEIVDRNHQPLPIGPIGRLRVRAPGMAVGYHAEERASVGPEGFHCGWYYPGEVASFDADGFLYVRGRASDMIRRNGTAVFPGEVEAVLQSHPAVQEAAVLGLPRGAATRAIVAVVVLQQRVSREGLRQHGRERLPPEKRPNVIRRVRALPKLPTGKVAILQLRQLLIRQLRDQRAAARPARQTAIHEPVGKESV